MASTAHSHDLIQIGLLGEAVEHLPAAVFVFDEEGRYVAVNGYACERLGYTREELLERTVGDLATARESAISHYLDVVRHDVPEGVAHARAKDGSEVTLRFRARRTKIAAMTYYVAIAW